jgi:acetyltransferase-like isoleucine patch superfamily enzyme
MRGPTLKRGCQIGVNVTILPFVTVGEGAVIGSGAVVVHDVPPGSVVVGNPGRVVCRIDELKCSTGLCEFPYRNLHGA